MYTWTHVFISVDGLKQELQVWGSAWRGQTNCNILYFNGDPLTFDYQSIVYIGGSPYSPGIIGKIVDVRYYESTSHDVAQAQGLALSRRCAASCWHSCWGPDLTSCNGFEFLDPHYSRYFGNNSDLNDGRLEFKGTDVKFKGHSLGQYEISASGWVYADLSNWQFSQLWWFLESGDSRRICAFLSQTEVRARTATTSNSNFGWILTFTNVTNKWIHIGLSLSQMTKTFSWCITVWGEESLWKAEPIEGDVQPITTSGVLYIGADKVQNDIRGIGGRMVDFRFFPARALSIDELKEIASRTTWAPSCNGSCWGPDTFSCNEYIQIVDPRFSNSYTDAEEEYTIFQGSDPRSSHYTFGALDFSTAFWVKKDSNYSQTTTQTLIKVHHKTGSWCNAGTRQPQVSIHQSGYIQADVIGDSGILADVKSDVLDITDNWWHIVYGVSNQNNVITLCQTNFSLSSPVTKWNSEANSLEVVAWDPTQPDAAIWVGDDDDWTEKNFQGKLVDVRYYPSTYLSQSEAEAMVASFKCVGDTEDCTGPDHTSVAYIRLTEKDYEYVTYQGNDEGVAYFHMSGTHVNFLNHTFQSRDYQVSAWVQAEERLANTGFIRFQKDEGHNASGNPGLLRKIPLMRFIHNYSTQKDEVRLRFDAETKPENVLNLDMSDKLPKFKKQFNVWGSVWNAGSMYDWFSEWGETSYWTSKGISTITDVGQFDSDGWAYVGGDEYIDNINMRISNAIYYPNSCYDDSTITSKVSKATCEISCNENWYGPGNLSCKFKEPLYLSDEWEPFIGDGTEWVSLRGYDDEFDGRFMAYSQYSVCTWFYLNKIYDDVTLYLIVLTQTEGDISTVSNNQSPALFIKGDKLYGQVVTTDGGTDRTHTAVIEDILIEKWYNACVVVDQSNYSITLYLGTFDGVSRSDITTFSDEDAGFFSSHGYVYYGGIRTNNQEIALNGKMLDIRYWDTHLLTQNDFQALISNKGWHIRWDGCTGPTSCDCKACQSPYWLIDGCCITTDCPKAVVVAEAAVVVEEENIYDCGVMWEDEKCTEDSQCTQCKKPYFRMGNSWAISCNLQYYESTTTKPDYQWLECHTAWDTWTGPGQEDWISWAENWYLQPDSTSCSQSCPDGYAADNTTWQICENFSGYSDVLDDPEGSAVETVCKPIWGDGELKPGEECDDGNVIDGDGCSPDCLNETWLRWSADAWLDLEAPKATLIEESLNQDTYTLLLYFDEPVIIEEPLPQNVEGSISSNIEPSNLSIVETSKRLYNAYQISVTFVDDVLEGTVLTLKIKTKITDLYDKELANYTLSLVLTSKEIIEQMQQMVEVTEITMVSAIGVTAVAGLASAGGAAGAAGAGGSGSVALTSPATFWGFVEVLQIINYMLYLAAETPYLLDELFKLLSLTNGSFMPDVFGHFVVPTGIDAPTPFAAQGISSNFFLNAGSFIQMFAINWILLGFFVAASKFLPKVNYFQNMAKSLWISAPLRIAVEGVLDLSCACAIQLRNYNDDSIENILGMVAAVAIIVVYVRIIYVLFTRVILQDSEVLQNEDHQKRYGAFYEGYATSHWIYKSFYLVEAIRRVLFVLFLVFLAEYRSVQIYAWVGLQFAFLLANIIVRPATSTGQRVSKIAMETILMFAFVLIAILDSDFADGENRRNIRQWVLFWLIGILVATFALYVLVTGIYDLIMKIYNKIKKCRSKGESIHDVAAIEDVVSNHSHKTNVTSILNKSDSASQDISVNRDDDEYEERRRISTSRNDQLFAPKRRNEWFDFVIE